MGNWFETEVLRTIRKHGMVADKDKVLVGVSGGPDSMALLFSLFYLRTDLDIQIAVGHLHHMMRGLEADEDEEYVKNIASDLGLVFISEAANVPEISRSSGIGIEAAGRKARYAFLERIAANKGFSKIALGHNKDDQAETVLMRLLRGSGANGLSGIPPVRDLIIRPLIETFRGDIERYCRQLGLTPRLDRTNLDLAYTRNKIRYSLMPLLEKEYNPNVKEALSVASDIIKADSDYLTAISVEVFDMLARVKNGKVEMEIEKIKRQHVAIQRRIIRLAVETILQNGGGLSFAHVENVRNLMDAAGNGQIQLPTGVRAEKEYEILRFCCNVDLCNSESRGGYAYTLSVPGRTSIPEAAAVIEARILQAHDLGGDLHISMPDKAFIDLDSLVLPITVRTRRQGDYFYPLGLGGSKKLKDFFMSLKIAKEKRSTIPVIVDANDRVVWIAGLRLDDRFKLTKSTARALALSFRETVPNA